MVTEDIGRLQWRGRWRRLATLEYYLQESAVQGYMSKLPPESCTLIGQLSRAAPSIVQRCLGFPSSAAWCAYLAAFRCSPKQ
eukprot:6176761-Amphidinium_carterae.2